MMGSLMATKAAVPKIGSSQRVAALDGWRGIAILLVLIDHFRVRILNGRPWPHSWIYVGQHGVTMFFVLSGFLITAHLIQRPDLKRFYIRRFFRLMPTAWLFLGTIFVAGIVTRWNHITTSEVYRSLAFVRNFMKTAPWMTEHFWSLSMEEQFYIVWPIILLSAGVRRARWIAACGATAVAVWRFLMWGVYDRYPISFRTEVRADALLAGCLLALFLDEPRIRNAYKYLSRYIYVPCIVVIAYCMTKFQGLIPLTENIALAGLIGATYLNPNSMLSTVLAWKPLTWLGLISYSLYLWQQPFFWTGTPEWCMCLILVVAAASYYLIEKPCIALSHRFTKTSA